ncbi:MarR family winged helix-turn-helix transcriptional regulator [Streptomyces sp. NBC_00057]
MLQLVGENFGPHVQRELASRLRIDRSDMVKIVDDLAVAGLVDRARDTTDRRRVTVTPTRAGRAMLGRVPGSDHCWVKSLRRSGSGR